MSKTTKPLRKVHAAKSTITYDRNKIDAPTGNIYESISIIAQRASQINAEIKRELVEKLEEFATNNDSLEEVFENKEQIEVSKYYEQLPKPQAIAVKDWLNDEVYYRFEDQDDNQIHRG